MSYLTKLTIIIIYPSKMCVYTRNFKLQFMPAYIYAMWWYYERLAWLYAFAYRHRSMYNYSKKRWKIVNVQQVVFIFTNTENDTQRIEFMSVMHCLNYIKCLTGMCFVRLGNTQYKSFLFSIAELLLKKC